MGGGLDARARDLRGMKRVGADPFAAPPEERDPGRRLRGRLAAPVTVWCAWHGDRPVGLTVSSVMTVEGDPPSIAGLVGPLTDLWEAVEETGRFVVHVLDRDQVRLADQFAGRYPADPFDGVAFTPTPWGPVIDAAPTRACCLLNEGREVGFFVLVTAQAQEICIGAEADPLVNYRGEYFTLRSRR
jgi:3-hydroxy-9,10-secoandrosta-1,3,5(10)-triene-9,17-dione monooxygenase reductase component